jgi:hypothetical protein
VSARRSSWHLSKPATIDDALPPKAAVELVSWDAVDTLWGEYILATMDWVREQPNDPVAIQAKERQGREIAKGWPDKETPPRTSMGDSLPQ